MYVLFSALMHVVVKQLLPEVRGSDVRFVWQLGSDISCLSNDVEELPVGIVQYPCLECWCRG